MTTQTGGFLDAHIHLWEFSLFNMFVNLAEAANQDQLAVALKAKPVEGWRVGVRFNQESLAEKVIPDRTWLDQVFGREPALIVRTCLHVAAMNTAAMERLGFHSPTGIFLEVNVFAILKELVKQLHLEPTEIVRQGLAELAGLGVTRVIDMGMDGEKRQFFDHIDFYTTEIGLLPEALGFKLFLDGGLGARTAALTEGYTDDPGNYGLLNHEDDQLIKLVAWVHRRGKPVAVHAIGDRAVDQFLRVIKKNRHPLDRLEHVQYARPEQLDELARLEMPVCIQPVFSREIAWAGSRLGFKRMATAYAWGLMRQKGIRLLAGSDAPVDLASPGEAARAADALAGNQHLDYMAVLDLYAQANWDFYGWPKSRASANPAAPPCPESS